MPRGVYERKPKNPSAQESSAQPVPKSRKVKSEKPAGGGDFIAAIDSESRLVLINGSAVTRLTEDQTTDIAALLAQHYE